MTAANIALSANQQYAYHLKEQLAELRQQLFLNLEKQRLLRAKERNAMWKSFSSGRRCIIRRRAKLWDSPHFIYVVTKLKNVKMNEYEVTEPNENGDTKHWRERSKIKGITESELLHNVPVFHHNKTVTKLEKNIIITSARCDYIERAKQKVMAVDQSKADQNSNGRRWRGRRDDDDKGGLERQNELRLKLMNLDQCSPMEIDQSMLDWKRISHRFIEKHKKKLSDDIQMVKHREVAEYKRIWTNYIRCDHSSWSSEERQCLQQIVRSHGGFDWVSIHRQFGEEMDAMTNGKGKDRSVLSLFAFYQQNLNIIHTKHDWTRHDDEILILVSKEWGEIDHLTQSYYLDRRLPHQCSVRLQLATGNAAKCSWNRREDLVLLLLMMVIEGESGQWSISRDFVGAKTEVQCKHRFNHFLSKVMCRRDGHGNCKEEGITDGHSLDLRQIILITDLLRSNAQNLWAKWSDISYVVSWNEFEFWTKTYREWKQREDAAIKEAEKKKANKKGQKRKRRRSGGKRKYSPELVEMKRSKLHHHKYIAPAVIARVFCLLFGGKSGYKLFGDDIYGEELIRLLLSLKAEAIRCQQQILSSDGDRGDVAMDRIEDIQRQITSLVDHPLFTFESLIANVVTDTVYFDDDIDSIQCYLSFGKS